MKEITSEKIQVKQILSVIQEIAPGKSVELRIPPYAAIQCVAGSTHRRGTPANVVEMDPKTLLELAANPNLWAGYCRSGQISASGINSDLSEIFTKLSKLSLNFDGGKNGK